jgi:KamA family protein
VVQPHTATDVRGEPTFRAYTDTHIDKLAARARFSIDERLAMRAVAAVLPFRTNTYVVDELIDWMAVPDDPIFRLTFPQSDMLAPVDLSRMVDLLSRDAPRQEVRQAAHEVRSRLSPHPGGQMDLNMPFHDGAALNGMQHKYSETLLFFPRQGQTCHAYCTYCFRWPQFVGEPALKMATNDTDGLLTYLLCHPEITDVLITGGDPLVMSTLVLERYIEVLLDPRLEGLESIRIGTKAVSYWPYRFVTDSDADDLMRLFERVVAAGKHLAVMGHFSHPRELELDIAATAVRRIRGTGAVIRCQAPLIRGVNDDPSTWATLWRNTTRMGAIPYYMFVERDTGPQDYFAVPLARGYKIFRDAYKQVSGLARTVRGPIMSAAPGKVCVDGVIEICGEQVFVLHFVQARDPELVNQPFFARFDPTATWLTDLVPALGATQFPFEPIRRRGLGGLVAREIDGTDGTARDGRVPTYNSGAGGADLVPLPSSGSLD